MKTPKATNTQTDLLFYLYGKNQLLGPLNIEQLTRVQNSTKIRDFHWIMDSKTQVWAPIETAPTSNPFLQSQEQLGDRELSAAFVLRKKPYIAEVQGMHQYGMDLFIEGNHARDLNLKENTEIKINLMDETHSRALNTIMRVTGTEHFQHSTQIRLAWTSGPITL